MSAYLEIIILALIAGFILLRLRSVLGRRTGNEPPPQDMLGRDSRDRDARRLSDRANDNVVPLPNREREQAESGPREVVTDGGIGAIAAPGSLLHRSLAEVLAADRRFDVEQFLDGARAAYKMIIEAFGAGDLKTLRPLLGEEVFSSFDTSIHQRDSEDLKDRKEVVGIISAEIVTAGMEGRTAEITVKFQSEIHSLDSEEVRQREATEHEEDVANISLVTDIWTFSRNTRARDPNWQLVATRSVH